MEPDFAMFTTLIEKFEQGDIAGALDLLFDNRDAAGYGEARAKYADMVETLQGERRLDVME